MTLPTGTVTFLFTDIEGSTRLLQQAGERSSELFAVHDGILRQAIEDEGGVVVRTEGDSFFASFASAPAAVAAAVAAQRLLSEADWQGFEVRVRMGLHTGEGRLAGDDYHGIDVHQAARVGATGHGGQVVLSATTVELVRNALPDGVSLRDLGLHRLKDFDEEVRLYDLVIAGLPQVFPPLRSASLRVANAPPNLTSFVGRETELEDLVELLGAARLVTLTGPGGTGKTRLALAVAERAAAAFDNVVFVPLAAIVDPQLLIAAITAAIGLHSLEEHHTRLLEYLKGGRTLLLLDNFEQIVHGADQVGALITETGGLTVLVTSRAPLRLSGEHEFAVSPLPVPDPGEQLETLAGEAGVRLFVDRATAVRNDFVLDAANAAAVVELIRRLDGLPLAIELAAARVKVLSPQAIVERLTKGLDLLASGRRDVPERQRTIRATIAWSHDLLDVDAQRLLRRLSVFSHGADLESIEQVDQGQSVFDTLDQLVEHSLVRHEAGTAEPRYGMLETIREFAMEQLVASGEEAEIRNRHLREVLRVAVEVEPMLLTAARATALGRLDRELDNLRAALNWAVESGQADLGSELAGATWRYWHMRGGLAEGRMRVEQIANLPGGSPGARMRALEAAGGIAYWQADHAAAGTWYNEWVSIARREQDWPQLAEALYNAAFPRFMGGGDPNDLSELTESLDLFRRLGDDDGAGKVQWASGVAKVEWALGNQAWLIDDLPSAIDHYVRALEEYRHLDDSFMRGWVHRMLGTAKLKGGDVEGARADLDQGMRIFAADGDVSGMVYHLRDFTELAMRSGDLERTLVLFGAYQAQQEISGVELASSEPNRLPPIEPFLEAAGASAAGWLERGRRLSLSEAVSYALAGS
jgi:predicted ATPase/class 3 adenylate cyclase